MAITKIRNESKNLIKVTDFKNYIYKNTSFNAIDGREYNIRLNTNADYNPSMDIQRGCPFRIKNSNTSSVNIKIINSTATVGSLIYITFDGSLSQSVINNINVKELAVPSPDDTLSITLSNTTTLVGIFL